MEYILSIDQGTTSSRAILYDNKMMPCAVGQKDFPQHFPQTGWVEHELEEIWTSVRTAIAECLDSYSSQNTSFSAQEIAAIGITNQRETFGLWDRKSSKPCGPAIVWQCRRSAAICERLKKTKSGQKMARNSGLVLDPYFSGSKLKWLLDKNKGLKARAKKGELAFGTIDTYLIWKLSGGKSHSTDVSNASRTLMMDLKKREWNPESLRTLGVPKSILPEIKDSNEVFAHTDSLDFIPDGIPISGVLGDQQAALFGQSCLKKGESKITYGTGAFLLINVGEKIVRSRSALSTVAWSIDGKTSYALEASVFIAGAAVQWLRDGLNLFEKSSEIESLAKTVDSSDGVFFVPALTGLGSPYWAPDVRGVIGGLSRGSTKAHVARACLEGIAHSIADVFEEIVASSAIRSKFIGVDGGASKNNLLMQYQADLLRTQVIRPKDVESTARGAAYMAALGAGIIDKPEKLRGLNPVDESFIAKMKKADSLKRKAQWRSRIKAILKGVY